MSEDAMGRFAREDLRAVFASFGVGRANRAVGTGDDEEILLIPGTDYDRVDVGALTVAIMEALPHVKVWVIKDSPAWKVEPV